VLLFKYKAVPDNELMNKRGVRNYCEPPGPVHSASESSWELCSNLSSPPETPAAIKRCSFN